MSEIEEAQDNEWMNAPMGAYDNYKVNNQNELNTEAVIAQLTRQLEEARKENDYLCDLGILLNNQIIELKLALEEAKKERDELIHKSDARLFQHDLGWQGAYKALQVQLSDSKLALAVKDTVLKTIVSDLTITGERRTLAEKMIPDALKDIDGICKYAKQALSSPSPSLSSIVELVKAVESILSHYDIFPNLEKALSKVKKEYGI